MKYHEEMERGRTMLGWTICAWKEPPEWRLHNRNGVHVATVWRGGTWHTWDAHGVGGENASAVKFSDAMTDAEEAVVRQGWHMLQRVVPGSESDAAAELVCCLYLYPNYRVDSRGPAGCILAALDELAPEIATQVREEGAAIVYQRYWSDDDHSCRSNMPEPEKRP